MTTRRLSLAITLSAAVLLAGCGSIGEAVSERAIEEGLEAAGGGGDVEIDLDDEDGGISIETSEGSMQIGNADIPDGFPDSIPLPADATIMSAMAFSEDDGANFNVTMTAPGTADAMAADLEGQLTANGYEIVGTFEQDINGESTKSLQFQGPDWAGQLIVAGTSGDSTVSYTVTPASAE